MTDKSSRLLFLDGLRGYAAVVVVIHHTILSYSPAMLTGVVKDSQFSWDIWLSGQPILILFGAGNFSVCLFFLLSGFVLSHVFSRSMASSPELIVRRYIRLVIPIFASNVLIMAAGVIALIYAPLRAFLPPMPGALDRQFTNGNMFNGALEMLRESFVGSLLTGTSVPTFNGVLWSMQVEFYGSVLLIAIFSLVRHLEFRDPLKAAAIISAALIAPFCISMLTLFLVGVILYWWINQRSAKDYGRMSLASAALILVGLYLGTMPDSGSRPGFANSLLRISGVDMPQLYSRTLFGWAPFPLLPVMLWHAIGAELFLFGVLLSPSVKRFFSSKLALFLGFVSFPLYLLHTLAKNLFVDPLWSHLGTSTPSLPKLLVGIAAAVTAAMIVAYFFAKAVETRAVSWSVKIGKLLVLLERKPAALTS